jgi:hypothetical protein
MSPVTPTSSTESYVITASHIDYVNQSLAVTFSHRLDGQEVGQVSYTMSGTAFTALFGAPAPDITTPLAAYLTTAIYNSAVAAGVLAGTVTPN